MKALRINVSGRVQGVFFRASTRDRAQELGLNGWCRNDPDGSVTIHAEGEDASLADFALWCHQGPRMARVDNLKKEEVHVEGINGFEIKR